MSKVVNSLISGKAHYQIGCETTQIYYEHLNSRYGFQWLTRESPALKKCEK